MRWIITVMFIEDNQQLTHEINTETTVQYCTAVECEEYHLIVVLPPLIERIFGVDIAFIFSACPDGNNKSVFVPCSLQFTRPYVNKFKLSHLGNLGQIIR